MRVGAECHKDDGKESTSLRIGVFGDGFYGLLGLSMGLNKCVCVVIETTVVYRNTANQIQEEKKNRIYRALISFCATRTCIGNRDRISKTRARVHTQLFYNSSAKLAANKFRNNCGKSLVSKQMWPVPAGNASSIRAASSDKLAMKMAHAFTSSFDVKAVPKS